MDHLRRLSAGVAAPGVNVSARDLPGFDAGSAGRRPWYLEDEAEPRVDDAGPVLVFALAKRNDVVLPYRDLGVRGCPFTPQHIAAANG